MKKPIGSIATMALVAALLAGVGYWQFAGVGLTGGEHEGEEREHETENDWRPMTQASTSELESVKERLVAQYGGRVIEVEQENDDGRALFEVKLVDASGQQRKVLVDRQTEEVVRTSR
jgi:uncharacterized membrane protein YkoI